MKQVYICSPYKGDTEHNLIKARGFCRFACMNGFVPIAPHIHNTQFLDDSIPEEREAGLYLGMEILKRSDEVWVLGERISEGMKAEIAVAKLYGIKIKYFKERNGEIHEAMA